MFLERKGLGSIFYLFFLPRIVFGTNVLFIFYIFDIDRINFYVSPFIGIVFILDDITVFLGILFYLYVLTVGFVYPYDVTAKYDTFSEWI